MTRRGMARALATTVAVALLGLGSTASPAAASGDFPVSFTGQTALTIEYGEAWYFELSRTVTTPCDCPSTVTLLDGASGKSLGVMPTNDGTELTTRVPLYSQVFNLAPLTVGKHSFTAQYQQGTDGTGVTARTDAPAQVTVTPAKLSTQFSVTPDPSNPSNVILNAALTGRFVTELDYYRDPTSATMPAGTWTFTATDATGKVAYESKVVQDAGTQAAVSKYWLSPATDVEYIVEAGFVPDAAVAANFAVTAPETVTVTLPTTVDESAPVITSPTDGSEEEAGPTGPSVPAFLVWLYSIALLALIGGTVFLVVRSRRAAPPKETIAA